MNKSLLLPCALLTLLCAVIPARAQEEPSADVVRVETRVVFVDALVQDKRTRTPVRDLTVEDFEVLDDGRPRAITYFSGEGDGRTRPLALVLDLNLATSALLYLERPEIMEGIISALGKLPPGDEVAVAQTWLEPAAPSYPSQLAFKVRTKIIEGFTRDRAKTYAALRTAQQFARETLPQVKMLFTMKDLFKAGLKAGLGNLDPNSPDPPLVIKPAPDFQDFIETAPALAAREGANSQVIVARFTDDLESNFISRSAQLSRGLIGAGVTVNGVIVERNLLGKAIDALGTVMSPAFGLRFHTTSYYSRQTGGEAATVGDAEEFRAAVDRMIGNLAARYSLGFTINGDEKDDGRMRRLEVRVKARDAGGKRRAMSVSARRGYYLSDQKRTAP